MIKIAIVDDESYQIEVIIHLIKRFFSENASSLEFQIFSFTSGEELLIAIDEKFDIILLDYQMPELNGYETAERIRKVDKSVRLIFVTGFEEHWQEGYKVAAYRYILKPIVEKDFFKDLSDVIRNIIEDRKIISFNIDQGLVSVQVNDLIYAVSNKRSTDIHILRENSEVEILHVYSGINVIEAILRQYNFIRPHISYCVNKRYVSAVKTEKETRDAFLQLTNGEKIYIARDRKKNVMYEMKKYLEEVLL